MMSFVNLRREIYLLFPTILTESVNSCRFSTTRISILGCYFAPVPRGSVIITVRVN